MGKTSDAIKKLRRLKKSKMPQEIVCECPIQMIMGRGCVCGALQAEKILKTQEKVQLRVDCKALGYLPAGGDTVVVCKPKGSIDHGGVPLFIWHACDGRQFEVLQSHWDEADEGQGYVLLDTTKATNNLIKDHWFPLDGIELP